MLKNAIRSTRWVCGVCLVAVLPLSAQPAAEKAAAIRQQTNFNGGFVAHIGCGDGALTAALRAGDATVVQGWSRDAREVAAARADLIENGHYGPVTIAELTGNAMPYIDNFVTLIVADDLDGIPMAEVMRALRPLGAAWVGGTVTVKPWPDGMDEWTHYMHSPGNNAVADDDLIGPPRHLQWMGSPKWARHHDHMHSLTSQVSAGGRLFYIIDEGARSSIMLPSSWALVARDAFNGTVLWKRRIPRWHTRLWPLKSGPAQLPRRLVAVGDTVYVTLAIDGPALALDAATGKTLRTYDRTAATEEIICSDGVLFLLVNEDHAANPTYQVDESSVDAVRRAQRAWMWSPTPRTIAAVDAASGRTLWRETQPVAPLTLAADADQVYAYDGESIVARNRTTGQVAWISRKLPRWETIRSYYSPTLVVHDGVVLFTAGENMVPHKYAPAIMTALDASDGRELWQAEHPPGGYQSPEDILVAGGLVWSGAITQGSYDGVFKGRDLRTGEVKGEFGPDVETHWFHHRCYRAKATETYLLTSRTGIEFLDPATEHWTCHHWVRGGCLYGIMPGNGMVYAGPHPCACYIEAKMFGMTALAAATPTRRLPEAIPAVGRLVHGPAYDAATPGPAEDPDLEWPTFRRDALRSGATTATVKPAPAETWETDLGGDVTSVTVAGGRLFVATLADHTLHALDATSGKPLWHFTAGGRIDSPPTIWRGRAYVGSHDGWVYCLRASDGALCWRFRAAPMDRRHMAFEQIESVWPVFGSVLIEDGKLYCTAGRSMFVDGGLRFLRLDAETGALELDKVLDDKDPETGENLQRYVTGLNMTVALPDILSSDDRYVYMRSQPLSRDGERSEIAYRDVKKQKEKGDDIHLFSSCGFLDDSWWHRAYWIYGRSVASGAGGYYLAGKVAPSGRILAVTGDSVYGFGRKPQYYRWTTPIEYQLYRSTRELPDAAPPRLPKGGSFVSVPVSESLNAGKRPLAVEAWVNSPKGDGVVVARGGPANGFALVMVKGKPQFVVRANKEIIVAPAKQKAVGRWVHLAGVLTPEKKVLLYVDGEQVAAVDGAFLSSDPAQDMEIGADLGGSVGDYPSPNHIQGSIDEVRVYDGALTAAEVAAHAADPKAAAAGAKLVARYSFDDGTVRDSSRFGNHGTAEGVQVVKGPRTPLRFKGGPKKRKPVLPHSVGYEWSRDIPFLVRAMAVGGNTIFVAGPPDTVNEDDAGKTIGDPETIAKLAEQAAALEGRRGTLLWAVSTEDGTTVAEQKLAAMPRWDGMAIARGKLYITTVNGTVMCLE